MQEKIVFETEDGENAEFFVLEETRLAGVNYLLVADSEDEDAECLILKDISDPEDQEAIYIPVEDDKELDVVMDVFEQLLEDVTIDAE